MQRNHQCGRPQKGARRVRCRARPRRQRCSATLSRTTLVRPAVPAHRVFHGVRVPCSILFLYNLSCTTVCSNRMCVLLGVQRVIPSSSCCPDAFSCISCFIACSSNAIFHPISRIFLVCESGCACLCECIRTTTGFMEIDVGCCMLDVTRRLHGDSQDRSCARGR